MNAKLAKGKKIERKHPEEERLKAVIDAMGDGLVLVDMDGKVTAVNPAMEKMSGYPKGELVGKDIADVISKVIKPEDLEKAMRALGTVLEGKVPSPISFTGVSKDGREIPATFTVSFLKGAEDKPTTLIITIKDITELKRAEEALRESEERFRNIAENALEWIWEVDAKGKYTYTSPVVEKILGYKPGEVLKKHFYDLFHPEDREDLKKAAFEVFAKKQPFPEFINRNVRKNGKTVWLSTSGVPILDEKGNLLGYRGADTDVTERKRAEEALRESEGRYRTIFEQAADSVVLIDAETGALVEFNDMAHENLGYTREEFAKLKIPDFEVIESVEEVAKHIEKIIKEGADTFETKHRTKGGEIRDIQVRSRAISIRGKDFVQIIWHDITERKQMEEERLKAAADRQRIEELERFAKVAVGRELKMVELKERIKELESKLEEITGKE